MDVIYPLGYRADRNTGLLELSPADFAHAYHNYMEEKYGTCFKSNGRPGGEEKAPHYPLCHLCKTPITDVRNLRYFYGWSLDPEHFREEYERQRSTITDERDLAFWNRVAEIEQTSPSIVSEDNLFF